MAKNGPFSHAIPDPALRAEIAFALHTGEATAAELVAVHNVSPATVRRYATEVDVDRRLRSLPDHVRSAMIAGCRAGDRRRWEKLHGKALVAAVLAACGD